MTNKIEVFNGSQNKGIEKILFQSIEELKKYIPNIDARFAPDGMRFINALKSKVNPNGHSYDADLMMDLAFTKERFSPKRQKIILINDLLLSNGSIMYGFSGGRDDSRQTAIVSTYNLNPINFYAVLCHELGHMYGATNRKENIVLNGGKHCIDNNCVMHVPGFNSNTKEKMTRKLNMYCPACQKGLRDYKQ